MKTKLGLALVGTCVGVSFAITPATAMCGGDGLAIVTHLFDAADGDGDGSLSAEEYEVAGLERYGVSFEQSDLDGSGATSRQEYLDLYRRHHRVDGETEA